ncbi:MAG TPA: anthranilate synthase component I family protein [Nitrospirales bacterium]|nr:anthranilate synthase component I family protein [Nitrospirales bacterium]
MSAFSKHAERGAPSSVHSTSCFPLIQHCFPVFEDPFDLYGRVTGYAPHSFFIEHDAVQAGVVRRFSYLGCDPSRVVRGKGLTYESLSLDSNEKHIGDPFAFLQSIFLGRSTNTASHLPPFQGGAIGCFSYDLARMFEVRPERVCDDLHFPDLYFLFVEIFVVVEQHVPGAWLIYAPSPDRLTNESWDHLYREGQARLSDLQAKMMISESHPKTMRSAMFSLRVEGEQSPGEYMDRVRACQHFIAAGDIYQANLSHRFRLEGVAQGFASQAEAGADLYRQLRKVNPSPHSAFLVLESDVIVCNSPERLVRLSEGLADMRPIAGTRPRGIESQDDRRLAEDLLSCPKERAEHLMLVDLARNDLGRVCAYGSVRVNELMTVERYSHVMHMVSHVSGRMRDDCHGFDLIRATFPGGTITGVPKVHCMELIEQLEPVRRGIYTGSIGFIGWNGNLDFNIAIRTLLLTAGQGYLHVGAGIVADSDPDREYKETLHKAEAFFQILTKKP